MKKFTGFCLGMFLSMSLFGQQANDDLPEMLDSTLQYARGHNEFRNITFKLYEEEFARLAREGQHPRSLFIGCSDSRVMPDLVASTRPGDLFVIRNAGNFVPEYSTTIAWDGIAATIEYAVEVLGIREIIVCGHSDCGAIQALYADTYEKGPKLEAISKWLQFGQKAKTLTMLNAKPTTPKEELYENTELVSVLVQLDTLLTYPYIKEKVKNDEIRLHGWWFDIKDAQLWFYNPAQYKFERLVYPGATAK